GEREEVDGEPIQPGLLALLDQALLDELLQQAVRGWLREAELLAQLADAQSRFGAAGQCPHDLHRAMQAGDRLFVFRIHSGKSYRRSPLNGIGMKLDLPIGYSWLTRIS